MRRGVFILLGVLGVLLVAAMGGVVLFTQTDWGRERVRRYAVDALQGAAHGRVRVGRVSGNLLTGITVDDFSITDSAGNPFVAADSVTARYTLRSLASKRIYLDDVRLVKPVIVLDRPPGGQWNYERIFPRDTTPEDSTKAPGFGSWIQLTDAEIVRGEVVVRIPWEPEPGLTAAQRDSLVRAALSGETRNRVVRAANGYSGFQQVIELHDLDALLPKLRIADPATNVILAEVARLNTIAAPFQPPEANVRDLAGTFELNGDSLWFQGARARLPNTQAVVSGRYVFEGGDLAIRARANPAAFADLRWAYPALPDSGGGRMDFALNWSGPLQRYVGKDVDVRTGETTIAGQFAVSLRDTSFEVHETDVRFAALDSRLIAQMFPTLALPRPGVLTGRVAADGTADTLRLDSDVVFDDRRAGRNHVIAVGAIGFGNDYFRADDLRLTLDPVQVALFTDRPPPRPRPSAASNAVLRVQEAEAREPGRGFPIAGAVSGRLVLDGSTESALTARGMDLTHLDRGLRSRVTGNALVRLADRPVYVNADLVARPLSLAEVGRLAPAAGLRGVASGPIRARGTLRDLFVDSRLTVSGGGAIAARGRLDLESDETGYDLAADARLFNANAVTTKAPRTRLTATARARGRGFDPATMRLEAAADVQASQFDTLGVDAATLRLNVANGVLALDTLGATVAGARLAAAGTLGLRAGRTGEIIYHAAADSLAPFQRYFPRDTSQVRPRPAITAAALRRAREDSAQLARSTETARLVTGAPAPRLVVDTPAVIRRDSLSGAAYAAGVLRGGLDRLEVRGRLGLQDLVAFGNTVKEARVEYALTDLRTPQGVIAVAARGDSLHAIGFALDSVDVRVRHRLSGAGTGTGSGTAQVAVFQDTRRDYAARADYRMSREENELRFADLRLRFDSTQWTAVRPGAVRFGPRGVVVDTIDLVSGGLRRIYVNGLLPTEGLADATVVVSNFEVGDALALAQSDLALTGAVSVAARIRGTTRAPQVRGAMGLAGATYNGSLVPSVRGTFDYAGERLTARAEAIAPDSGARPLLVATGTLPVNLALQGATGPRLPEGRPLTARVTIDSLPLALLPELTTAVTNLQGVARGEITVSGALPRPTIAGALALDSAAARLTPLGVNLVDATGRLRIAQDTVFIDSLTGTSGRGTVRLAGRLGIDTPARPFFNLQLRTENARVLNNDLGRLVADAQIAAYGPYDGVRVSGGVVVRNGVVYLPEDEGKELQVLSATDPAVFAVADTALLRDEELLPTPNPLLDNLQLDLSARVERDVWVRSREANVEVYTDGDIAVGVDRRGSKNTITLAGTVNSERGQYEFQGRRFEITRGQATFLSGGPQIDATVQATAEYEVPRAGQQALIISLLIGGTVSSPRLSLESNSQPPITQSDLLGFLAFGRSTSSLLQQGGSSLTPGSGGITEDVGTLVGTRFASTAIGVFADQFEKSVARSLRADVLNVTAGDVPTTLSGSGVGRIVQNTEIEYGRYLSNRTFLGVVARPDPAAFQDAGIGLRYQYRMARGLQLESTYQPRYLLRPPTLGVQEPDAIPVFGVFLVREWRF